MTEIAITDQTTIEEIKTAFKGHFPFLNLEFYEREHEAGQGSPSALKMDEKITIGEARTKHTEGQLSIHGNQKVKTLEAAFHDVFGLNVQVFRRSGNIWLQTTATDEWTLSEQNETAKEFSTG